MHTNNFITPIIKLTDICNYNCEFCYYAQKKQRNILYHDLMPIELAKKIMHSAAKLNSESQNKICHLIFHGGEPLLVGLEYFSELMQYEEYLNELYPDIKFENSIETNGYLINNDWIDFFRKYNFGIGISIDGPDDLNFHKKNSNDIRSDLQVLNNIKKLNEANMPFGVMSVITNKHLSRAKDLYEFYQKNNIHNVGFCFCYNTDSSDSVDPDGLTEFLKDFFHLYFCGSYKIRVREFEEMLCKILNKNNSLCLYCNRERCGNYPTIDSHGNVFFCDFATEKNRAIGNITQNTLEEIIQSNLWLEEREKSKKILTSSCQNCDMQDLCGKICYRSDKLTCNNRQSNYFCNTYKNIMLYVKEYLQKNNLYSGGKDVHNSNN